MNLPRSSSIILTAGLILALIPLGAEARSNQHFSGHPNFRGFNMRQPRMNNFGYHGQARNWGHPQARAAGWNGARFQRQSPRGAFGWNRQNRQWRQPRGTAYGWHGQRRNWQQPQGRTIGWNGSRWQQHPGNAFGWNRQDRQWRQPRGTAYGWQGHHNWQQPRGRTIGWNGSQSQWQHRSRSWNGQQGQWGQPRNWQAPREQAIGYHGSQPQWQQHRQSSDQGYQRGYRQFQPNQNGENSRPSYTPINYSGSRQIPSVSPGSFSYPSHSNSQVGRSYPQSGFHRSGGTGSSSLNQTQVPSGPTQISN